MALQILFRIYVLKEKLQVHTAHKLTTSAELFYTIYGQKKTSGIGDKRGRLIYRAWDETNGKVIAAYFKAVENVTAKFNKRTSIVDIKRAA